MTRVEIPHATTIEIRDTCAYCGAPMSDPGPCYVRTDLRYDEQKSAIVEALREAVEAEEL